jgi:lon-related putative ATP-dependent protease
MANLDFFLREITAEEAEFSYTEQQIAQSRPASFHGEIIGQPRAVSAIEMGIKIPGKGYNIFVSGESGTGRSTAIRKILAEQPFNREKIFDIAFIHNFIKPEYPVAVRLRPGEGRTFVLSMQEFIRGIKEHVITWISEHEGPVDPEPLAETAKQKAEAIKEQLPYDVIAGYLDQVIHDVRTSAYIFNGASADSVQNAAFFNRYTVNLLVDHADTTQNPVIFENHPTFSQLMGSIDGRSEQSDDNLPFLSIHAGSLLESSGGTLVLDAEEILKEDHLWDKIKQVLKTSHLYIQNPSSSSGQPGAIRPEPVQVDIKLILLGTEEVYEYLFSEDPDFYKLFKISAEFDFSMPATPENIGNYIGFVRMITEDEGLLPVDNSAVSEILLYGSYLVEQRNELSTQFSLIADLVREANYHALHQGRSVIDRETVLAARMQREYLSSLSESKIIQQILSGEMLIRLEGSKIGMVNALAVLDRGYYSFGIPAVISATVAPGTEGIVNIEHEAGLSGEIHDKGLLILEGYLRKMYARNFPLSIYSGICFEQSYAEVDGDSASSSELYALLSAVGDLPIRQDVAVTGSVNQMGEIQPVGGINEKIIGFYRLCKRKGLTGSQGVIIPDKNIRNLILPQEIISSIAEKKFHIYPISSIDEGMQILTLRKSGKRGPKGTFPPNTINRVIEDKLKHLSSLSRQNN